MPKGMEGKATVRFQIRSKIEQNSRRDAMVVVDG